MIYSRERKVEILAEGKYKGYHYVIVSMGTHPCAYVEVPRSHKCYNAKFKDTTFMFVQCHGGVTFASSLGLFYDVALTDQSLYREGKWIGWDYMHTGVDCIYGMSHGKQWRTEEIYEDIKRAVNSLIVTNKA